MSDDSLYIVQVILAVLAAAGLLGILYSSGKPVVTKLEVVSLLMLSVAGVLGIGLGVMAAS